MTLVLDTSILIDLEKRQEKTIEKLEELSHNYPDPAKVTFITQFEFIVGLKEKKLKNKEKALIFLNKFIPLQTTHLTGVVLAELKTKYDAKGLTFSLSDLLVATITMENKGVLVTKDKDFEKIEELRKIIID